MEFIYLIISLGVVLVILFGVLKVMSFFGGKITLAIKNKTSKRSTYSAEQKEDPEIKELRELISNDLMNQEIICILDLETTGFNPEDSEIVEIFILKVKDNEIIDEFYSLIKPKSRIQNSHIHGVTDYKVQNAPRIQEKNDEIFEFIENSTLVGHNLDNFDLKFLNYHLNSQINNKTLDTLKLSRKVLGNKVENHKLNTLAEYFDIEPPTHSARDDVMATYEVYKKLISIK